VRGEVVEELDTESLAEIVAELPPDDAADVLSELTPQESDAVLDQIPEEQSEKIEELLAYDERTAGGIMTTDVVAVTAGANVREAVEQVRDASPHEDITEVYVVDDDRRLIGTVSLQKLVISRPDTKVAVITEPAPVTVNVSDDQETVYNIIHKYSAMAAAVVDEQNRLVGRITHDDVLDVATEEAAQDMYRMAGTDAAEFETHSVFRAARIRLTWILPCMFGMLLSATVLRLSEPKFDMTLFAALVLFVPMIGATGGNSGVQISTVIVRAFAMGDHGATKLSKALFREGRIALTMAPVCGLVAWVAVMLFFPVFHQLVASSTVGDHAARVALAVGCGMTVAILTAALLGIALPFTFRRIGVDPALASGPLVTTVNDVMSVGIYMVIAMMIAR